jgi:hypothetical protein
MIVTIINVILKFPTWPSGIFQRDWRNRQVYWTTHNTLSVSIEVLQIDQELMGATGAFTLDSVCHKITPIENTNLKII